MLLPDVCVRVLPILGAAEARLAALEAAAEEKDRDDASRLVAHAGLLRAEIALAAGDPEAAAKEARAAVALREAEHAARRWSLDASWYERARRGFPADARAAPPRAAGR